MAKNTKPVELEHVGTLPVFAPKKPEPDFSGWLVAAAIVAAVLLFWH